MAAIKSRDGKRCVKTHIPVSLDQLIRALAAAERVAKQDLIAEALESRRESMLQRLAAARKLEKF